MSEKKYIDAEELNKLLCEAKNSIPAFNGGICKAKMIAREMPAADVEEVKHGEWRLIEEDADGNGNNQYMCSLCDAGELHAPSVIVPYCWKCGAKMDKEKEK